VGKLPWEGKKKQTGPHGNRDCRQKKMIHMKKKGSVLGEKHGQQQEEGGFALREACARKRGKFHRAKIWLRGRLDVVTAKGLDLREDGGREGVGGDGKKGEPQIGK